MDTPNSPRRRGEGWGALDRHVAHLGDTGNGFVCHIEATWAKQVRPHNASNPKSRGFVCPFGPLEPRVLRKVHLSALGGWVGVQGAFIV